MRTLAILGVVAVCLGGAALAQSVQAPEPFVAEFDAMPDGRAYGRNYPADAIQRHVEGAAVLCCVPDENGYLECAAALEWPEGFGFGDASVRVAREFHLSPDSAASFRATPGNWIRRTLVWRLADGSNSENERAFATIREMTAQLCHAPDGQSPTAPQP
jgi:hypothetical protein